MQRSAEFTRSNGRTQCTTPTNHARMKPSCLNTNNFIALVSYRASTEVLARGPQGATQAPFGVPLTVRTLDTCCAAGHYRISYI